jgi:dephospho-CoA kinase
MLLVGITGNIASGKSTVANAIVARGATLIDSDADARATVAPGTSALAAIVARFGVEMLLPDGTLDRGRLGRHVFRDVEARQALELIVHPAVEAARQSALARAQARGDDIVLCDIPLLFEARLAWQFPRIILVDAPAEQRISRLMRDRGMARVDADARVSAQMPAALKRGRADVVVDNAGDRDALVAQVHMLWQRLRAWRAVAGSGAPA